METFGGRGGVLNRGSIESAIGRPYSGYYRSIERKGAALIESLALYVFVIAAILLFVQPVK